MAKVHSAVHAGFRRTACNAAFQDKVGTGWHVVIRYHEGHEREISGFASEQEALEWIVANANQLDK
jgi:hypothetical protein